MYGLVLMATFLSTLPARGATAAAVVAAGDGAISIHAPREGSDISGFYDLCGSEPFLSTLPARGATYDSARQWAEDHLNFYPRSPRGERRQWTPGRQTPTPAFLSTLPARGATPSSWRLPIGQAEFLSTLPARGATGRRPPEDCGRGISIHAPREGSDSDRGPIPGGFWISIHAPREGSDAARWTLCGRLWTFLSTLPARGATGIHVCIPFSNLISIHAPREGSDAGAGGPGRGHAYFYPRSPRGERPFW